MIHQREGQRTRSFPFTSKLDNAKPLLITLPGWKGDISTIRSFDDLPIHAQQYVQKIEELIGVPIHKVSVGPKREQMINTI